LATVTEVSRKAFTKSSTVITLTTAGAITSHGVPMTFKRVVCGWTFNQAAVWATKAIIALAAIAVLSIPGTVIFSSNIFIYVKWNVVFCKLFETLADTMTIAVTWACSAAASFSVESWEAFAFSSFAVAFTFTGALQLLLVVVVILGFSSPCVARWASSQGAISACPCCNS